MDPPYTRSAPPHRVIRLLAGTLAWSAAACSGPELSAPPHATTADTSASTVDSAAPPDSTDTDETPGSSASVACDPDWSAACHVVDGICRDPSYVPPWPPTATDAHIDQSVSAFGSTYRGPLVWTICPGGGAIVHGSWSHDTETPSVDVFDESTRAWIAGFVITDDPFAVCGTTVFVGDETWYDCADAELSWLYAMFATCAYPSGGTGPATCSSASCLRDEVPR